MGGLIVNILFNAFVQQSQSLIIFRTQVVIVRFPISDLRAMRNDGCLKLRRKVNLISLGRCDKKSWQDRVKELLCSSGA